MNERLLAEARAALKRGWIPTPLHGKIPTLKGWTKAPPPSDGELYSWVYAKRNIGIRTGAVSGDLVVIDVDPGCDKEIVAMLDALDTPTVRTGRGKHYYVKGRAKCSVGKITDDLDIRGDGGQVVMPGSIHPDTGEPYTWIKTPDEAPLAPYPPWLEAMAHGSDKVRKAPEGKRNDTLNRATFAAAKLGAPTRSLADAAIESGLEPREIEATINSATDAAPKFVQSMSTGDEILVPGEHFLNGGESITVDQTAFVQECWKRIPKGIFYHRMGVIGEIYNAQFQPCDPARFRYLVSGDLRLCAYVKIGRTYERQYADLNHDLARLVMSAGPEYTPELRAITKYPLWRGPHPGWISLYKGTPEPVTDHRLFWETVLADFPFASASDLHSAVAMALTLYMRPMIDGPIPIFLVSAAQPATGKTKLISDVLARLVYGRSISGMALGDDDAEVDKRLISRASTGHTVFFFDNVTGKVDCPVLAAFSTATSYSARILGQSKTVEFQNDAMVILTANNATMSEELARRTWNIRLESKIDHPEARTDFIHPQLGAYLDSVRAQALGSLQAIAEMIGPGIVVGSYEEWGRLVGGAMAACGMPLSQTAFGEWMEQTDDAGADLLALVKHWIDFGGSDECDLKMLLEWVKTLEIMPRVREPETEVRKLMRLGYVMGDAKRRVLAGHQIQSVGKGTRRRWRLVRM